MSNTYRVYIVAYYNLPESHHSIFLETGRDGSGYLYEVIGALGDLGGMKHQTSPTPNPESAAHFLSKTVQGTTDLDKLEAFEAVCKSIPAPAQQYRNGRKIDPDMPDRHCQHWVREAIAALKRANTITA